MVVLLLKGFTDADMGGTYSGGDIYVFYLVLVYFNNYKKNKIHERKSTGIIPIFSSRNQISDNEPIQISPTKIVNCLETVPV